MEKLITKLADILQHYNQTDLLLKLAALRLVPENCDHVLRIDTLCHIVASRKNYTGITKITSLELNTILNSDLINSSSIARAEYPVLSPLCEEIIFHGGGYRIFPGNFENQRYTTTILLDSIFLPFEDFLPSHLKEFLYSVIIFVFEISERISKKANIKRNTKSVSSEVVIVPDDEKLSLLANSLLFTKDDFTDLIGRRGINKDIADLFCINLNDVTAEAFFKNYDDGELTRTPIIKIGNLSIVTDPSSLINALKKNLLDRIDKDGYSGLFAIELRKQIWSLAETHLDWLKTILVTSRVYEDEKTGFMSSYFSFDIDKVMIVCLLTDDLSSKKNRATVGNEKYIYNQLKLMVDNISSVKNPPNEITVLYLFSHINKRIGFNFCRPPYDLPLLVISTSTLETIASLEGGKNLFLYKYTLSKEKTKRTTDVVCWDTLIEYGFFKSQKYSYYFKDDKRPDYLSLDPEYGRDVYYEAIHSLDRHAVVSPLGEQIYEMIRLHPEEDVYIRSDIPSLIEALLEAFSIPIWFICDSIDIKGEHRRIVVETIDMFTYWFQEMKPSLAPIFEKYQETIPKIVIKINIDEHGDWISIPDEGNIIKDTDCMVCNIGSSSEVIVDIFAPFMHRMYSKTNEGERFAIKTLLRIIGELFEYRNLTNPFEIEHIENLLDRHASLGRKKKISTFDNVHTPEIDPRDIIKPRLIEEIETDWLLDEIGAHVISLGINIPTDIMGQSSFINKHIVGYLYSRLREEVYRLNSDELIDWLITQNESLIYKKKLSELQFPMQIEIADSTKMHNMFTESSKENAEASIASRFLLEYVVAQPSRGIRPLSDSVKDRLITIASEIVTWGFTSDLLHYNVADVRISLLGSGRIGRNRETYERALNLFSKKYYTKYSSHLSSSFDKKWGKLNRKNNGNEENELQKRLNTALLEEYGFSMFDYSDMVGFLHFLATKANKTIFYDTYDKIREALIKDGNLIPQNVDALLHCLTLEPRNDYFGHPDFKEPHHYYPWRFNRSLSCVRRPLMVQVIGKSRHIKYGIRMLYVAFDNFFALVTSGRLHSQVKSKKLQRVISEIHEPHGLAFNKRVAEKYRSLGYHIVESNITHWGKVEIEFEKGKHLGDIDVLAIDIQYKTLHVIECKDIAISRTPYEFHQDIKEVFEGDQSHLSKHLRRVQWVRLNFPLILSFYNIPNNEEWQIRSEIVLDEPLYIPQSINDLSTEIIFFGDLK